MSNPRDGESLPRLVHLMQRLLAEDGCPWDRAQTLESLRPFILEEAHELVEAIDAGSPAQIQEELGDLVMQFVFCAELARRQGWFGPDDAIAGIVDKLTRRHPHLFDRGDDAAGEGEAVQANAGDALASWDAIKRAEKPGRGALDGVPVALPALLRAVKIGQKAARIGLDWEGPEGPRAKIDEELAELDAAVTKEREAEELGDLLFAAASWARKRGHDPEAALRGALRRFEGRVRRMEASADEDGVQLEALTPADIDARWERAKA